jgi:hypothetical protein
MLYYNYVDNHIYYIKFIYQVNMKGVQPYEKIYYLCLAEAIA